MDIPAVIDPTKTSVLTRFHWGEEMQEPENMAKSELQFPSGENSPVCWVDANYKSAM